jgi:hypothetical protein
MTERARRFHAFYATISSTTPSFLQMATLRARGFCSPLGLTLLQLKLSKRWVHYEE